MNMKLMNTNRTRVYEAARAAAEWLDTDRADENALHEADIALEAVLLDTGMIHKLEVVERITLSDKTLKAIEIETDLQTFTLFARCDE